MATAKVFKSYIKTPFLILLFVEIQVLFWVVYVASYLRFNAEPILLDQIIGGLWVQASLVAVITPLAMLATGLYQGRIREGLPGVLLRLIISFAISAVFLSLLFYLFPGLEIGRGIMAISYFLAFFVIGTFRAVFLETADSRIFKKRVLIYGAGETASHIDLKLRRKSDRRGFDIVAYVALSGQRQVIDRSKLVSIEGSLLDYVRSKKIDQIVVASSDLNHNFPVDELVDCKLNGVMVSDILTFFEHEAGQVRIDILEPSWLVTSDGFRQSLLRNIVKRMFDVTVSLLLLIAAFPIMVLTVIAIWAEEKPGAPVLYSQLRVGKNGMSYKVYKFRSMHVNAEMSGKAVWASKSDNRVTRTGSFIRKTRIDELPQILNVLNGSMSLVGPRPERPEFVEKLTEQIPYYRERHVVKPGITGWAQLLYPYGSSVNDAYQKQIFDMYYVKNNSLFLDLLIILQTVEVVLFGKGAR